MAIVRFISLILFLSVSILPGQNYTSFPVGEYWHFPDARSLSLGGAGSVSYDGPGAMQYNPAALTQIDQPVMAEFSFEGRKLDERRSFPLYDRFDSFAGYGIYSVNNHWYFQPSGAISFKLPVNSLPDFMISAGSFVELDQNYEYQEEVRENIFGDPLKAINRIEFKGTLRRYGLALAGRLPFFDRVSVGLSGGVLNGSLDYLREVNFIDNPEEDLRSFYVRDLDNTPVVLSAGLIYRHSERIRTGFDVSLPYSIEYVSEAPDEAALSETIEYPLRLNWGFEYRAQQELQARLNVDIGYEFWSKTEYSSDIPGVIPSGEEFSDVFVFKAGIEHIFFNKVPFRVGTQYRNSYRSRGNTRTLIAAGTGFMGDSWKIDVSGGFSNLKYTWPDLFDDKMYNGDRSNSPYDEVKENYFTGKISFIYFLNW